MGIGATISARRKALNLTQKQLGIMCGYDVASAERVVQFWEHDRHPVPMYKLRILAESLQIPLESLIP